MIGVMFSIFMLNLIMPSVMFFMKNVIMLCVVMVSVVAPFTRCLSNNESLSMGQYILKISIDDRGSH